MANGDLQMRCQRCGALMDLKDPGPGEAWTPDQFWVCLECDRHFWTTYPAPKTAYTILRPNGSGKATHAAAPETSCYRVPRVLSWSDAIPDERQSVGQWAPPSDTPAQR